MVCNAVGVLAFPRLAGPHRIGGRVRSRQTTFFFSVSTFPSQATIAPLNNVMAGLSRLRSAGSSGPMWDFFCSSKHRYTVPGTVRCEYPVGQGCISTALDSALARVPNLNSIKFPKLFLRPPNQILRFRPGGPKFRVGHSRSAPT